MTPDRYPEKKGGRWPHVVHRWKEENEKWARYEEDNQLTPIKPTVLIKPPKSIEINLQTSEEKEISADQK